MSYDGDEICVFEFLTQRSTKYTASSEALKHYGMSGHGGADYHLMNAFISAVAVSIALIFKTFLFNKKLSFQKELVFLWVQVCANFVSSV